MLLQTVFNVLPTIYLYRKLSIHVGFARELLPKFHGGIAAFVCSFPVLFWLCQSSAKSSKTGNSCANLVRSIFKLKWHAMD